MQFTEFQHNLAPYAVFSLHDIQKIKPDFHRIQLDRWEKKGYLKKIKQGYYCLSGQQFNQNLLFLIANLIYPPSYISLQSALKFYGLIPEEIFQITSVSTKKTASFATSVANFNYRRLKPSLFFGYRLIEFNRQKLLLADPEKAILDYLYLHPRLKTADDFQSLRINSDEFNRQFNPDKFQQYLNAFESKALTRRAKIFLTAITNDQP